MLPVEVLVPGSNSRSKHCGIYTGPSLLEPYKSNNNIYIYKAAYNNMNHVIIFLVCHFKEKRLIINFHWLEFCLKSFYELHVSFNGFM